ncbi:branched-chain amino acid aminotransferase I, partial [Candidatus Endoriftia persephone str. Guaymas]|nr:branched-chain amino acid aminotransferase I [Candidatus Endoriftia persephone str. Guaymas]
SHDLWELLLNYLFPAIAVLVFWHFRSATPGKMLFNARVVDAKSFGKPSTGQLIGRYLGYYLSILGLGLGFF